ncbi:PEP-CTERM sorting domain-containing protein [Nitrosospira multiformis]|uniref:PEP-CTERM sorting domain-containing protein n=1 Tax=Nitrosospira multiformis TaxID=1231 RepID=UPI00089B1EEB|nr:PEP-CTERM sorting domain-containing protein [Nitrosospira multiformis]SEA22575.1 PEP-CTERM protein-sorting domain-containing protein [Nitrosospira multiformis]
MSSIKRSLTLMGCCAGFIFGQSAYADGTASASLDWSRLQVSVTGVDGNIPTVTFSNESTSLSSSAYVPGEGSEYNTRSIYDWTSTLAANADATTSTYSSASASDSAFSASAQSFGEGSSYYWDTPSASASGYRTERFTFDGPGVLTVTIPYTLDITGGEQYNYYGSSSASVSASANFYGHEDNGSSNSYSNASFSLGSYYGESPDSKSGNLVFGIFAAGPGSGSLSFNTSASLGSPSSMIPEPESYALMLAGLGLMSMIVRRRSAGSGT